MSDRTPISLSDRTPGGTNAAAALLAHLPDPPDEQRHQHEPHGGGAHFRVGLGRLDIATNLQEYEKALADPRFTTCKKAA